jgi:hypothetical protein
MLTGRAPVAATVRWLYLRQAMRRATDAECVWCPPPAARHVLPALGFSGCRVAGGGVLDTQRVDVVSQDQIDQ